MQKWHHANIVLSKFESQPLLFDIFERDLDFRAQANPDFLGLEIESFGIPDARNLEKWAIGKPLMSDTKVALIKTGSITVEAQNALLKLLEEPPIGTYIFINLENVANLLGTFLSRVRVFDATAIGGEGKKEKIEHDPKAEQFINGDIKKRFEIVKALANKEDKADIKNLIKNLEDVSYKSKSIERGSLKNVLLAKVLVSARGSSPRMILEWLSCVL